MVAEVTPDYPSQWAAITAVAQELGIGTAETLHKWVRRAEVVPRASPGSDKPGARRDQAAQTRGLRAAASQRDPQGSLHFVRGGARPPTSPLVSFINDYKAEFGVQPICAVLCEHGAKFAPSTHYEDASRAPSQRALRDADLKVEPAGVDASVGTVGDALDNALAESVIGLVKTELIRRQGPWRTVEHVEAATLGWVDWFNHHRLLEINGDIPPIELGQAYYRQATGIDEAGSQQTESPDTPGAIHTRGKHVSRQSLPAGFQTSRRTDNVIQPDSAAPARAMLRATGRSEEDVGPLQIAVANSWKARG